MNFVTDFSYRLVEPNLRKKVTQGVYKDSDRLLTKQPKCIFGCARFFTQRESDRRPLQKFRMKEGEEEAKKLDS